MVNFLQKAALPLLISAAMLASVPLGASAQQVVPDQRTQAEIDAVQLLLDQGVVSEKVDQLGPKAEVAAYVLRTRKPDLEALNRLVNGLLKYADGQGYNGSSVGGMLEQNNGELRSSPGAPLEARMMSRKPMDVSLNGQPSVLAPWDEYREPLYFDDKAYFPLYRMMTMLGGDAKWNGVDWEVTAISPWGSRWKVPIGEREIRNEAGDTIATLSGPVVLADSQVLVPYDFWNTLTGYRMEWDRSRKSLSIVTEPLYRPEDPVEGYGGSSTGYVVPDLNVRVDGRFTRLTHLPINYEGILYYPVELIQNIMDLTAEYDSQSRRLTLTTNRTIEEARFAQPALPSPHLYGVPVNTISYLQYTLDGVQSSAEGKPLQLSSPLVENQGRLYAPINELAAIAGYQVSYTADKTLYLNKPVTQRIREKLMPGVSRDRVRMLLGNQLQVVYNAVDGTRSWQYRFLTETADATLVPQQERAASEKPGGFELEAVDRKALGDGTLKLQLFVHHDPAGLMISGYTLYTGTSDGIQETRLHADGSVTERLLKDDEVAGP
ncbi:copper amine oxidase N-terminal domain-containing protein [Paenibacillus radicis (ex Xue et al. 2023)]|uniref:Copper amine oxidase N-terminal domain-containing protein n=1 Tax=Paenibacillus radicis (ex Xue et al. 2023) TaxID=2972489 RepID=A0ABT1YVE5_9BACL|nr:copper amine oxidase N-terminal domain-containing protein [Paenibacillus radicis (ex Xue et al. 2023)]MCR8636916.1 copper amine oxidase N-terminal domain-containing protein [Paenibacillus radicis (ex Xue et al. 2023)]